jgi:hypothetical protein
MPTLSLGQIQERLRRQTWRLPTGKVRDLTGEEGKALMSKSLMKQLINEALQQWAMELWIHRDSWTLDDGSGGEGTLTVGQRKYALPPDLLLLTEARVAYNNTNNFLGYPLILTSEPFLADKGTAQKEEATGLFAAFAADAISHYVYAADKAITLTFPDSGGTRETILFSALGADLQGLTPPTTFENTPHVEVLKANVDADINRVTITKTSITIGLGIGGSASPPFLINLTLGAVGASLGQLIPTENLPQRMFIWQDVFYIDPVPNDAYTLRMFGYKNPAALAASTSVLDTLTFYHESIFNKAKLLIARELNVLDEPRIQNQYNDAAAIAKKFADDRHNVVRITAGNVDYWQRS